MTVFCGQMKDGNRFLTFGWRSNLGQHFINPLTEAATSWSDEGWGGDFWLLDDGPKCVNTLLILFLKQPFWRTTMCEHFIKLFTEESIFWSDEGRGPIPGLWMALQTVSIIS